MRSALPIAVAGLLALFATACGGGSATTTPSPTVTGAATTAAASATNTPSATSTGTATATTASASAKPSASATATTPPAGTATPAGTPSPATTSTPTASAAATVPASAVVRDTSALIYRVTYEADFTDPDGTQSHIRYEVANRPPQSYFSFSDAGNPDIDIIAIDDGQAAYLCTHDSCFRSGDSTGDPVNGLVPAADIETIAGEDSVLTRLPGRTVAGVKADCYRLSEEGAEGEVCLSAEGIVLFEDGTFAGQGTKLTATAYSLSVADSQFVPPFPLSDDTDDGGG